MSQLPDKPSELIRVALADLEKCEGDPRYVIDMGSWHEPRGDVCHVCLAGSVMANTLGVNSTCGRDPSDFRDGAKLQALNEFRLGSIECALSYLRISKHTFKERNMAHYRTDPNQFKVDMNKLADDLEEAGY